jgi:hypothetical protein
MWQDFLYKPWLLYTYFTDLFVHRIDDAEPILLLRPFTGPLYQPWMTDGDDCGAIGGINEW